MKHPLEQWREENRYSRPAFGQELGRRGGKAVTGQAVRAWEKHQALPPLDTALLIAKITGGKVKPESFVKAAQS